jgi:hypothetical protein
MEKILPLNLSLFNGNLLVSKLSLDAFNELLAKDFTFLNDKLT